MPKPQTDITPERVRELFDYDPRTGALTWRDEAAVGKHRGPLGSTGSIRYIHVRVEGKRYYAHRLAWVHYYGRHPQHIIDHINGDKRDNRIANLRDVDARANNLNFQALTTQRKTATGLLGAFVVGQRNIAKRFCSRITAPDGKRKFLGYFMTAEEAHAAYMAAKTEMFPEWMPRWK